MLDVAYPLFSDLPDAWPGVSRSDFGPLDFESGLLASGLLACRSFIDVSIYDLAAKDAWGQGGIVDTHLLWLLLFLFFLRLVDSLVLFPVVLCNRCFLALPLLKGRLFAGIVLDLFRLPLLVILLALILH